MILYALMDAGNGAALAVAGAHMQRELQPHARAPTANVQTVDKKQWGGGNAKESEFDPGKAARPQGFS
jgi:hypothetical protein